MQADQVTNHECHFCLKDFQVPDGEYSSHLYGCCGYGVDICSGCSDKSEDGSMDSFDLHTATGTVEQCEYGISTRSDKYNPLY